MERIDPRHEFLLLLAYGTARPEDFAQAAVRLAYRDFQRTLTGFSSAEGHIEMRERAGSYLSGAVSSYLAGAPPAPYDEFHRSVSDGLLARFDFPLFTYGCAQKWINMTMKYLYCLTAIPGVPLPEEAFQDCHIPVDNVVLNQTQEKYGIGAGLRPWSRLQDYEAYLDFQHQIRGIAKDERVTPLQLDFKLWKA